MQANDMIVQVIPQATGARLLLLLCCACLSWTPSYASSHNTVYVGRDKPEAVVKKHPRYRILNRSRHYVPPPLISAQIHGKHGSVSLQYDAPRHSTVHKTVQVIAPQQGVVTGGVHYRQQQYNIYEDDAYPQYDYSRHHYPRKRYHPRRVVIVDDPHATERRSKQWTDKMDFMP